MLMYEGMGALQRDGVHGLVYLWQSGFYRFLQSAKLFERRMRAGQLQPEEVETPASVEQLLEWALQVARQSAPRAPAHRLQVSPEASAAVVWSGPVFDPSGYGDESRNLALALADSGLPLTVQPIWNERPLDEPDRDRLLQLIDRPVRPGFVHVLQTFGSQMGRNPDAGVCIGRTMFETDRLPDDWVRACNQMDWIWTPTEFNRQTFADSGVDAAKLVVIPACLDRRVFEVMPEPVMPPAGNPLSSQELDGTRVTWAYDVSNQLNHEQRGGTNGYNVTYIYGMRRNRSIKNDSGQVTTYIYDNADQISLLTPPTGQPTTSTWDGNGNLLSENTRGNRTSYTWDGENRLTGVVYADGTRDTLSYDASGMRQKKVTSTGTAQFVWDGQNVLQEKDGTGATQAQYSDSPGQWGGLVSQRRGATSNFFGFDVRHEVA